jgi:hypothetical protein
LSDFSWWTFRKHLKQTPDGFIVTEFLLPVPWAGLHNSINCPAGHRRQQPVERGKDHNHSTFCDLIISGLVGIRPRAGVFLTWLL